MTTTLDMISGNSSILTLYVVNKGADVHMDEIIRFISEQRLIVNLTSYRFWFTADGAIFIIRQLNSLKEISIHLKNRFEYDHFLNQLDKE